MIPVLGIAKQEVVSKPRASGDDPGEQFIYLRRYK